MTLLNVVVLFLACFAKLKFISCALPDFDSLARPVAIRSPPKFSMGGLATPSYRYAQSFFDEEDYSYEEVKPSPIKSEDDQEEAFAKAIAKFMQSSESTFSMPAQDYQYNDQNVEKILKDYSSILKKSYVVSQATLPSPSQPQGQLEQMPIFFSKPVVTELETPRKSLYRPTRDQKTSSSGTTTFLSLNPKARDSMK